MNEFVSWCRHLLVSFFSCSGSALAAPDPTSPADTDSTSIIWEIVHIMELWRQPEEVVHASSIASRAP